MMLTKSSSLTARALCSRQTRSLSTPKMHKASGNWDTLKAKRPIDEEDLHTVFHPPFNKATVYGLVSAVIIIGAGSMQYGFVHQQYKQGYWK